MTRKHLNLEVIQRILGLLLMLFSVTMLVPAAVSLVYGLAVAGQPEAATEQVAAMQHLRHDDGSYWTGLVFADDVRWPVECTTWTAAAVVLAADAISGATPASGLFTDAAALPPAGMPESDADLLPGGTALP